MNQDQITTANDAELLQRFETTRDHDAFAELVKRHGPMVLAVARRVLKQPEDVEEAFQATMLALAKAAGKLQRKPNAAGWLYKVAYTCAAEHRRLNARWKRKQELAMQRQSDELSETNCASDPSLSVAHKELESILDEELMHMSAQLREVIVLCDLEEVPQKEAAKLLGLPTSSLYDRLAKGRKQLHKRLVNRGASLTVAGIAVPAAFSCKASSAIADDAAAAISKEAVLFAIGKTDRVNVSSTVVHLANKPLALAKVKSVVGLVAACLAIVGGGAATLPLFLSATSFGEGIGESVVFVDDFADGNLEDNDPVSWIRDFDSGRLTIVDESLVLTGTGSAFATISTEATTIFEGTSMRTQARLLAGDEIGLAVRNNDSQNLSYVCALNTNRVAVFFGGLIKGLAEKPVDFDITTEDVVMQLDAFGDTIQCWVWPANEARPHEPTLTVKDSTILDGRVFLFVSTYSDRKVFDPTRSVKGAFRFVNLSTSSIQDSATQTEQ